MGRPTVPPHPSSHPVGVVLPGKHSRADKCTCPTVFHESPACDSPAHATAFDEPCCRQRGRLNGHTAVSVSDTASVIHTTFDATTYSLAWPSSDKRRRGATDGVVWLSSTSRLRSTSAHHLLSAISSRTRSARSRRSDYGLTWTRRALTFWHLVARKPLRASSHGRKQLSLAISTTHRP